jgi:Major Facilitator Superfamily
VAGGVARYRALLGVPGGPAFSAASFVLRIPIAMMSLGTLLLLRATTGSYTIAGAVAAMITLLQAVSGPAIGRLVDRRGQSAVLVPTVLVHGAGLAVLLVAALRHWPTWTLFPAAAVYAAAYPPIGGLVRARWSHALAGRPELNTAYAVESVLDELIFVTGPPLVTVLATGVEPGAGLIAAYGFAFLGTAGLALQRRSEPPRRAAGGPRHPSPLRLPGLRVTVGAAAALGCGFGSFDVGIVAFTAEHGHPAAAGGVLALIAFGSMIAGLLYGAVTWRAPVLRRQILGLAAFTVVATGLSIAAATGSIGWLAVAAFCVGGTIGPALIPTFSLLEEVVPVEVRTEGLAWLLAGINLGVAVASSVGGRLVDVAGSRPVLAIPAGAVLAGLVVVLLGRRALVPGRAEPALSPPGARIDG